MSDKPALHPERIRAALRGIRDAAAVLQSPNDEVFETAIAALELVRKGQLALGLTENVVNAGRTTMGVLEAIGKMSRGGK